MADSYLNSIDIYVNYTYVDNDVNEAGHTFGGRERDGRALAGQ